MKQYECKPCGYIYDEAAGDPDNGIAPGTTATDFVDIASEIAMNRQPIGRLGTVEEMAELAAFLMSREGENIVGQTILSCGGSTY